MKVIRPSDSADTTGIMSETTENPYLRDAVLTATPEQLQLMLYDGAIRYALQARDAILEKDYAKSFERLTRAQNILAEMQLALNHDINRDLCERVAAIYNFIYRKLIDANVNRNVNDVDDAVKVLRIERETWQILVDKVNKARKQQDAEDHGDPSELVEETAATFNVEG